MQEVFIVLHRRQPELHIAEDPRGLLFGIARKVSTRIRAREQARAPRTTVGGPPNPEERMEVLEKGEVVQRALEQMAEERRLTFVLVDVEGMSVPEAAQCMGVNLNTAYGRLRAARFLIDKAIARYRVMRERGRRDVASRG